MKKYISIALSFILYLLVMFSVFLFIFKFTILNEDYMRKQIIQSRYVEILMEEMTPKLQSATVANGFDKNTFDSVISIEQMKTDVFFELGFLYKLDSNRLDLDKLSKNLHNKAVEELVTNKGIVVTDDVENSIKNFVVQYATIYANGIKLPFDSQVQNFIVKISKVINVGLVVILALMVLDIAIIFILNKRLHVRKLRYCIYAISASAITTLFLGILIKANSSIEYIAISSKALYFFVVQAFDSVVYSFFYIGLVLIVLLIVFVILRMAFNRGEISI